MNIITHQEKEKNEEMKTSKRKAGGEDRRLILKKLCAALLWSFKGHHGKKMR